MSKHRKDKTCLNCGYTVQENYCSKCGQENLETKESFGHLVSHYVADYLHFDSKFFKTLQPLIFRPGKLTREYLAGRRARYVHPFRLYIFITIVFYLLSSVFSSGGKRKFVSVADNDTSTVYLTDTSSQLNMSLSLPELSKYKSVEEYKRHQDSLPADQRHGWASRYMAAKIIPYGQDPAEFVKKLVEKFLKNLPKVMFVLLPVFALLVMLAYRKQRRFYMEHAIFSVHVHSFFFILLLVLVLLRLLFDFPIGLVTTVIFLIYLFFALKYFYQRGVGLTFLRLLTIIFLYGIVLVVCLAGNGVIALMML